MVLFQAACFIWMVELEDDYIRYILTFSWSAFVTILLVIFLMLSSITSAIADMIPSACARLRPSRSRRCTKWCVSKWKSGRGVVDWNERFELNKWGGCIDDLSHRRWLRRRLEENNDMIVDSTWRAARQAWVDHTIQPHFLFCIFTSPLLFLLVRPKFSTSSRCRATTLSGRSSISSFAHTKSSPSLFLPFSMRSHLQNSFHQDYNTKFLSQWI